MLILIVVQNTARRGGQGYVPVTTLTSEFRLLTVREVRGLDRVCSQNSEYASSEFTLPASWAHLHSDDRSLHNPRHSASSLMSHGCGHFSPQSLHIQTPSQSFWNSSMTAARGYSISSRLVSRAQCSCLCLVKRCGRGHLRGSHTTPGS